MQDMRATRYEGGFIVDILSEQQTQGPPASVWPLPGASEQQERAATSLDPLIIAKLPNFQIVKFLKEMVPLLYA